MNDQSCPGTSTPGSPTDAQPQPTTTTPLSGSCGASTTSGPSQATSASSPNGSISTPTSQPNVSPEPATTSDHTHDFGGDTLRDAIALYRAVLHEDVEGMNAIASSACGACLAVMAAHWGIVLAATASVSGGWRGLDGYLAQAQQAALAIPDDLTLSRIVVWED